MGRARRKTTLGVDPNVVRHLHDYMVVTGEECNLVHGLGIDHRGKDYK